MVVPAVIWAVFGLALALGAGQAGPDGALGLRLGLAEGGLRLPGKVHGITAREDGLHITLALPGKTAPELPELPDGIFVEYTALPTSPPGPPRIDLRDAGQFFKLAGGRHVVLTERYVLRFGRDDLRVSPRPPELTGERFRRWLREQQAPPEPPRGGRPGPGKRPGRPNV